MLRSYAFLTKTFSQSRLTFMIQRLGFATDGLLTAIQISGKDLLKGECTAITRRSSQARLKIWTHILPLRFIALNVFTKRWTCRLMGRRPCRFSLSAAIAKRRWTRPYSCATERHTPG